jgi:lysophospholipase L1-like esterase
VRAVRHRLHASSYVVAAITGALVVAGCGGSATTGAPATYVAMGDSYSSGAGIAPVTDLACARSSANYASLVAKELDYSTFTDVTCGGAMTTDLTDQQAHTGNAAQLASVDRATKLVTLTIGLNDQNLSYGLLDACLSASGRPSAECRQILAMPASTVDSGVLKAAGRVAAALRLIRKQAPKARIVLVGYPRILPDTGDCPDRLPLVRAMEPLLRDIMRKINDGWKRAAAAVGVDYVDTWTMSEGHDICAADPWVNGASPVAGEAAPMHPFPAFHRAVADAIVKLLRAR